LHFTPTPRLSALFDEDAPRTAVRLLLIGKKRKNIYKKPFIMHKTQKNVQKIAFICRIICLVQEIYVSLHREKKISKFIY
jgi:hypothetical protein